MMRKGHPQQAEEKALGSAKRPLTPSQLSREPIPKEGMTRPQEPAVCTIDSTYSSDTMLKYRSNLKGNAFRAKHFGVKPVSVKNCLRGF